MENLGLSRFSSQRLGPVGRITLVREFLAFVHRGHGVLRTANQPNKGVVAAASKRMA